MNVHTLYQKLLAAYGPRHWWPADSPFEMALGAILTQNTAWTNVEQAILRLRENNALTAEGIVGLPAGALEGLIRPAGYYNQKSDRIRLFARYLLDHYGGRIEALLDQPLAEARHELLTLKGVGPETADSILLYAGHQPSFVVDAYTRRLGSRLGLLDGSETYAAIRHYFMDRLSPEVAVYNEYHALIVEHCKQLCRSKPLCGDCFLAQECPYATTDHRKS